MDYKEKYEQGLECIQEILSSGQEKIKMTLLKERLQPFFPELKESEDELTWLTNFIEEEAHSLSMDIRDNEDRIKLKNLQRSLAWLKNQGKVDKESYDIAEKEKYDFVSGQFIQCRKSFYEFKEYNSYWFEYIGNDTYIGRSDNILNKKFHITPRQLYCLFTQQRFYPNNPLTAYGKYGEQKKQVHFPKFTFDDVLALQCCMETVEKVQEDKDLYEKLNDLHGRVYDAYHLENQDEQKPTRINKIWWRILQHINKAINTIKK